MQNKKGITLMVLSLTIVIISIISTAVVASVATTKSDAKFVTFMSEIDEIEENIRANFEITGQLPVKNNITFTKEELAAKLSLEDSKVFLKEVSENMDTDEKYMEIDLKALGARSAKRGAQQGGALDVYFLSKSSMHVYYLSGLKNDGTLHFTSIKKDKAAREESIGNINTEYIKVSKQQKSWTNKIDFNISCNLAKEDMAIAKIFASGALVAEVDITENARNGVYRYCATDKLPVETIAKTDKIVFYKTNNLKEVLASTEVLLDNLDIVSPVKVGNILTNADTVSFKFLDKISGVDTFMYCTLSEKNSFVLSGNDEDKIAEYIRLNGKKIEAVKVNNTYEYEGVLKLSNPTTAAVLIALDKAGNVSKPVNIAL
ncbi:MAG: hypothetical protein RSC09_05265 [Clostridia bacterium]